MSWVRFVPGFSRHIKRLKSGPISSWLWVCSVDYCVIHSTDGWIDDAAIPYLCGSLTGSALKRAVQSLVNVGSWVRGEGGFWVHDFLRHNTSKEQVEEEREQSRKRYRKWANQRPDNAVGNALATPQQHGDKRVPNETMGLTDVLTDAQRTTSGGAPTAETSGQRPHGSDNGSDALKRKFSKDELLDVIARTSGLSREELARQMLETRARHDPRA